MTVSRDVACIAQSVIYCSNVSFFAIVSFCSSVVTVSRDVSFIVQSVIAPMCHFLLFCRFFFVSGLF